mmetsp:Transcript_136573/g.323495  ORF Transcript_136573/g.323495 Transcript_136573/m.323495 type:complete len:281 (+) Transcript_136573:591-1433(+)
MQRTDYTHVESACGYQRIEQEEEEELVVMVPDTVRQPRAIMVHPQNISAHRAAIVRSVGLELHLLVAKPQFARFLLALVHEDYATFHFEDGPTVLRLLPVVGNETRIDGDPALVRENRHDEGRMEDDRAGATQRKVSCRQVCPAKGHIQCSHDKPNSDQRCGFGQRALLHQVHHATSGEPSASSATPNVENRRDELVQVVFKPLHSRRSPCHKGFQGVFGGRAISLERLPLVMNSDFQLLTHRGQSFFHLLSIRQDGLHPRGRTVLLAGHLKAGSHGVSV